MSAELQEAEEQIDVHDLPNFRFEGATQFDVNQESTTLQDAGGNSLAAQDEEADFSAYEMPDVIRVGLGNTLEISGDRMIPLLFSHTISARSHWFAKPLYVRLRRLDLLNRLSRA